MAFLDLQFITFVWSLRSKIFIFLNIWNFCVKQYKVLRKWCKKKKHKLGRIFYKEFYKLKYRSLLYFYFIRKKTWFLCQMYSLLKFQLVEDYEVSFHKNVLTERIKQISTFFFLLTVTREEKQGRVWIVNLEDIYLKRLVSDI